MTDDLTALRGVGPTIADNLREAGFDNRAAVMAADVEELAEVPLIGESTAKAILTDGAEGSAKGGDPIVDDVIDEIAELAELPISDRGVIRLSPIAWQTHKVWKNRREGAAYDRYREVWHRHRAKAEKQLAEEVAMNDPRFLLERAFGYTKEQKIEHEGDADVTVNFDDVDT